MKVFILVDENKIVRCIASEECNLHDDKLHMNKHHVEMQGLYGDEYDEKTDTWIKRPENYAQPSQEKLDEGKIQAEIKVIQRAEAIQNLKDVGDLPPDYKDTKGK